MSKFKILFLSLMILSPLATPAPLTAADGSFDLTMKVMEKITLTKLRKRVKK